MVFAFNDIPTHLTGDETSTPQEKVGEDVRMAIAIVLWGNNTGRKEYTRAEVNPEIAKLIR